jgi:hypothetical protein
MTRRYRVFHALLDTLVVLVHALHVARGNDRATTSPRAHRAQFKPTAQQVKVAFFATVGLSLIWGGLAVTRAAMESIPPMAESARSATQGINQMLSVTRACNA